MSWKKQLKEESVYYGFQFQSDTDNRDGEDRASAREDMAADIKG